MELKEVCISRRVDSTDKESVEGDATRVTQLIWRQYYMTLMLVWYLIVGYLSSEDFCRFPHTKPLILWGEPSVFEKKNTKHHG
jgi:hypothetical protein